MRAWIQLSGAWCLQESISYAFYRMGAHTREALIAEAMQSKANQDKANQSKSKQSKAKQSKANQSKAKQIKAKQIKARQGKSNQSKVFVVAHTSQFFQCQNPRFPDAFMHFPARERVHVRL